MRDDDLPDMPAALKMPVGLLSFGEREGPVDNGMEAVHGDRPVQGFEIGAAPYTDRAERNAAAGQQ